MAFSAASIADSGDSSRRSQHTSASTTVRTGKRPLISFSPIRIRAVTTVAPAASA